MNHSLNEWFKFQREGSLGLMEANSLIKESKFKFQQRHSALMKQKEKLYKTQDVNQWGTNPADLYDAKQVLHDPVKAYQYILPIVIFLALSFEDDQRSRLDARRVRVLHEPDLQGNQTHQHDEL